jgi:hypothetical protein
MKSRFKPSRVRFGLIDHDQMVYAAAYDDDAD